MGAGWLPGGGSGFLGGWLLWEARRPACRSLGTAGRDQTQQVWEILGSSSWERPGRRRIEAGLGVLPKAVYFFMGIMEGTTHRWWSSVEEGSCEEQGVAMCPSYGADPPPLGARAATGCSWSCRSAVRGGDPAESRLLFFLSSFFSWIHDEEGADL